MSDEGRSGRVAASQSAVYRELRNTLARIVGAPQHEREHALEEARQWLLSHCRDCGAPLTLTRQQRGFELCERCFEAAADELRA